MEYEEEKTLQQLVGTRPYELMISTNKKHLVFANRYDESTIISATGDCCSTSWIEHMEGVENLDAVITDVKCAQINEVTVQEYYEVIKTYSYTITTPLGECKIELRNNSNGFYGGELEMGLKIEDYDEPIHFNPLKEDF